VPIAIGVFAVTAVLWEFERVIGRYATMFEGIVGAAETKPEKMQNDSAIKYRLLLRAIFPTMLLEDISYYHPRKEYKYTLSTLKRPCLCLRKV